MGERDLAGMPGPLESCSNLKFRGAPPQKGSPAKGTGRLLTRCSAIYSQNVKKQWLVCPLVSRFPRPCPRMAPSQFAEKAGSRLGARGPSGQGQALIAVFGDRIDAAQHFLEMALDR